MAKIYLISPPQIDLKSFPARLEEALKTKEINTFQLRLKNTNKKEITEVANKLIPICQKYHIPFILNDYHELAIQLGLHGVHVGSDDGSIKKIRQNAPENFIIGASCYDSKDLILQATKDGASYVSLGTFFTSSTKNSKGNPSMDLLKWCSNSIKIPTVVIGGINNNNYMQLINNGADLIAIISYIWDNPKGINYAIGTLNNN